MMIIMMMMRMMMIVMMMLMMRVIADDDDDDYDAGDDDYAAGAALEHGVTSCVGFSNEVAHGMTPCQTKYTRRHASKPHAGERNNNSTKLAKQQTNTARVHNVG